MKRNIRNITIAFALTASIIIGNVYMPTVFAEETAETAETEVEIFSQEETESAEPEEVITAEMPELEEEPVIFDEIDETVNDSDMEEEQIVSGDTTETLEESEVEAEEENIPVVEEDAEAGLTRSAISDSDYAYVQEIVSENYPDRVIADSFVVSASGEIEYPASFTFDADVTADEDVLLIFVNGTDWNEICPDSVSDGSITATFYASGAVAVVKNNEKTDENIEDEQPGTDETEDVPFTYETAIDDIVVKIQADAGVFSANVTASVKKVYVDADIFDEENITETYSFDIAMYSDGEEVQPDTSKGSVMVTFEQIDIADDAEIDVYHVTENLQAASEKIQNIEVNNDGVSFEAEHFSVYTVIISTKNDNSLPVYVNLSYTLGEKIPMTEVLDAAGFDYTDYIYIIKSSSYNDTVDGVETDYGYINFLQGKIEDSYLIINPPKAGTYYINNVYIFKSDKTTKKYFDIIVNVQDPNNHDYQLGENVYADFDEESSKLIITGSGSMWSDCSNAISTVAEQVGNIDIAEGITSIGGSLFSGCDNLTGELIIPDSVTEIGSSAFSGCSGLTGNLVIPDSVTEIGSSAFKGCSGFSGDLVLPDSVTEIGWFAFADCTGFKGNLYLSSNVTEISYAFNGCNGFTGDLIIPDGVTKIGSSAFYGCSGFTGNLIIPDSVKVIDVSAFSGCSGFTGDLTIPNGVTKIARSAFNGCSGFTGNLVIPGTVSVIGMQAFSYCDGFTELTIGQGVTSIEGCAFWCCDNITQISIADSIQTINDGAFEVLGTQSVRTRLYTTNPVALAYDWTGSKRKLINDVSVTYHENGADSGTTPSDSTVYETDDLVTVLGNPGSLQKTGYFFQGWNTAADRSGTLYTPGETITAGLTDIDLYAQWGSYVHLAFDSNGAESGMVPVDSNTYKTGEQAILPANTENLALTGLYFWGWNTESDGTGTFYLPGESIVIGDTDMTLYAQYGGKLSVTYSSTGHDSGTAPIDSNGYLPGDTVVIMDGDDLEKTDYVMTGWNTSSDGSGVSYAVDETITIRNENIDLYAVWAEVTKWQAGDDIWAYAYQNKDDTYTLEFKGTGTMYNWSYSTQPWNSIKPSIKNVIIGDGITNVGERAFYNCTAIEKLIIGNDVAKIENYAIYSTSAIKEIIYPITLTTYGSLAFYNCTDPTMKVTITKGTGNVASSYWTARSYIPWKKSGTSDVTLEEGIVNIPEYMFYSYQGEELTIPSTVQTISANAFQYASNLKKVNILSLDATMETSCLPSTSVTIQAHNKSTAKNYADEKGNPFVSICELNESGVCPVCGYQEISEEFTVKIPLEINMTKDTNQFKGTADVAVDYYMETKMVNISVADFDMTDSTGDRITATGSVTGNGWHNGNTDATYDDADGFYHGVSHITVTAPARAGNYTGTMVFTISEQDI